MRFCTAGLASIVLVGASFVSARAADEEHIAESAYNAEKAEFTTLGEVLVEVPFSVVSSVGGDFRNYRSWALEGINGDEKNSRGFLTLMKDLIYVPNLNQMRLVYDLDVVFPFGRDGAELLLSIVDLKEKNGVVESYRMVLTGPSSAIEHFDFDVSIAAASAKETKIKFSSRVKLAYLINIFFNIEKYKRNVEWRILRMISNMRNHVQQLNAKPLKPQK